MDIVRYGPITPEGVKINMPVGAEIAVVGVEDGEIFLWAVTAPNLGPTPRYFRALHGAEAVVKVPGFQKYLGRVALKSTWHIVEVWDADDLF